MYDRPNPASLRETAKEGAAAGTGKEGEGGEGGGKEESKRVDRSVSDTLSAVSDALSARGGGGEGGSEGKNT